MKGSQREHQDALFPNGMVTLHINKEESVLPVGDMLGHGRVVLLSVLIYCMTLGKSFIFPQTSSP